MIIFILESLRKDDPKTGKYIHDFLDKKGFNNEFYQFKSKQELLDLLKAIKDKSVNDNFQPFVHFDCHGNENGIGVVKIDYSEELITWKEIREAFRDIYMASKHKSVICMSSCQGFNVIKMVAQSEPCPYDHVCGSFEKISFADGYYGYVKFYDLVLSGKSIFDSAVEVHNDSNFQKLKFIGVNSQTLFKLAIDGYLKYECTEEKLAKRKEICKKELENSGPLNQLQINQIDFEYSIEGQKDRLNNFAETFFSLK